MATQAESSMIHNLSSGEKEIVLVGTAHVSHESAELVSRVIREVKPDTVSIELCASRFQAIRQREKWQETDIVRVIRDKKAFLLLSNLLLAAFQKRIAKKLKITPGQEMISAIEAGEAIGAEIHLADRDVRITLSKTWRRMGLFAKIKLLFQLIMSLGDMEELNAEEIEKMKQEDVLETLLAEVGKSLPALKEILIDERDKYLAGKIRSAPGKKIVAVVGAGHVAGIRKHWSDEIDFAELERLPDRKKISGLFKWVIPLGILLLFVYGFFLGGSAAGTHMVKWWFLANGIFAGFGALLAFAHPFTVVSSVLAAPFTSLNPMIAAGWVAGLVEAVTRKPKVRDFEALPEDILSIKGFWRNKVTRILLVVVFTNLGSSIGTFVAIPLMVKVL